MEEGIREHCDCPCRVEVAGVGGGGEGIHCDCPCRVGVEGVGGGGGNTL